VPACGIKVSFHQFKDSEEQVGAPMRPAARKARPRGFCSPPTVLTDEKRGNPAFRTGKTFLPEPSDRAFCLFFFHPFS
jgi:hypothetical protein